MHCVCGEQRLRLPSSVRWPPPSAGARCWAPSRHLRVHDRAAIPTQRLSAPKCVPSRNHFARPVLTHRAHRSRRQPGGGWGGGGWESRSQAYRRISAVPKLAVARTPLSRTTIVDAPVRRRHRPFGRRDNHAFGVVIIATHRLYCSSRVNAFAARLLNPSCVFGKILHLHECGSGAGSRTSHAAVESAPTSVEARSPRATFVRGVAAAFARSGRSIVTVATRRCDRPTRGNWVRHRAPSAIPAIIGPGGVDMRRFCPFDFRLVFVVDSSTATLTL